MDERLTQDPTAPPDQTRLRPERALNLACHDLLPPKTPQRRYLVLSQPRTGSNYLCRRLCNVRGRFGLPSEYLNPRHIPLVLPRLVPPQNGAAEIKTDLVTYLTRLERIRTTEDGLFGIKIQPAQLFPHTGRDLDRIDSLISRFDRIILMTRRDKLGQAISLAISEATQVWFNDGSELQFSSAERHRLLPAIAGNLTRCIEEERIILDIGRRIVRPLLRIDYEEIQDARDEVFHEVTEFLSEGRAGALTEDDVFPSPKKPAGALASELRSLFLAYVQDLPHTDKAKPTLPARYE